MKKLKKIPEFNSEQKEREFWEENDATDYIDFSKSEPTIFPNLKPSTKTISIRLSESMLENIKLMANKRDIPYQSFIKIILNDRIEKDIHSSEQNER